MSQVDNGAHAGRANHRVAVVFLVLVLAFSSMFGAYELVITRQGGQAVPTAAGDSAPNFPLSAQLSVKVYDQGTAKRTVTENGDLVMNNFMNFFQSLLSYESPTGAYSTFTMTDTAGAVLALVGKDSASEDQVCTWACEITTSPYAGGYVAVGTGTTSPARSDHKLTSQYQGLIAVNQPIYDPSTGNIVLGVSTIAGAATNITEAGFFENWYSGGAWTNFLMFHDTFAAIAVTPGNTISVQYTVQLGSTAYNNNLGFMLAAILANTFGASTSIRLTPTAGSSQAITVYAPASYYYGYYDGVLTPRANLTSGSTGADSTIRVGTGSASMCPSNGNGFAQSRSANNLCQPVLSYTPVNNVVFSPYVAVTAVIPTTAALSFTEAGYFQSFGSVTYSFLLIRNTFTALAVPADSSATVTFELSMG